MGLAELAGRNRGAQLVALEKGREYAIASGDTRRQVEAWNEVGGAMLFGRTPVDEVLAFLDEELAWAQERGLAAVEADALLGGPYLYARLGRFEEARDRLERSKSLCRELGIAYGLAEAHSAGAGMEMLAGDADAAERELRDAIGVATDMGASRYVALYRTKLARVLVEQGRNEDASAELEQARDIYGDPAWKAAGALLLARRGETEEAVGLARGDRVHGGQRQHHGARGDPGRLRRGAPGARRPRRCRRGARRGGGPPRGEGQRPARQALPRASGGNHNRRAGSDDEVTVSRGAASRRRAPADDRPGGHGLSGSVRVAG